MTDTTLIPFEPIRYRAAVIARLRELAAGAEPMLKSHGMCANLPCPTEIAIDLSTAAQESWPKWSGVDSFPVPHPTYTPSYAYGAIMDLWNKRTRYGQDRREYCAHVADWLEANPDYELEENQP